jgi:hypothetical protein
MGTFYHRCDGLRDRVRSYAIAGYLRFRSSFFLIAIILFIFYTFCVILSTTVSIWSPRLDSGDLKKGAAKELGTVASDAQAFSSKVPTITSEVPATISTVPAFTPEGPTIISEVSTSTSEIPKVTSEVSTYPSAVPAITSEILTNPSEVPAIDHGKYPEKDPLIDLGKPLGKNPIIDLGYTKYQGVTRKTGVTQWLGIRYAAPPLGDLRFAEPKDPLKEPAVQRADKVRPSIQKASAFSLTLHSVVTNVWLIEKGQITLAMMRTVSSWTYMFRPMQQLVRSCQCSSTCQLAGSTSMLGPIQIEAA